MEMELEPSVKPLTYKVKGMSRESPSQKALHVLDTDLRSHWSTGTNTKEWILIELDEPALLSHIRIYNKSVLEWEISVGLRYKPEAFVKVRPRCEAPRRDMMYPMNYTPCRYVRISCLRGNPIAIFFIQLIGVSMVGLEPEFQPVINHLLPHIISHKQDVKNRHLQLLQDITSRLLMFLPQLEADLSGFSEAAETSIRFLAMLAGPFYPILHIVSERDISRTSSCSDSDASRNNQALTLTVSSNFEVQPRRSRCTSPFLLPASGSIVYRPDVVFMLLRKAYKDPHLKNVCLMASRVLQKAMGSALSLEASIPSNELISSVSDEALKADTSNCVVLSDYSKLFGEEFTLPDDHWDSKDLNVIDVGAVEEGILHVLYACASQPLLCVKLADYSSDFWSVLPMVQALLPALRPSVSSSSDQVDDSFTQWKHPLVQHALSQIVATLSSSVFRPLLNACAGYLSSFSPSHVKAASVLIDLCSGPLAPWIAQVVAKVDLTIELLEDLLGTIQGARHSITRARAALKYIILALSGHMDDILAKYKEVKHKILFLVEMLEPFLDPAITAMRNTIAFGDVSTVFLEKQERTCAIALNVIRTAVQKPAVLPSLESEWRRGSVAPSVLLSILGPHMQLPPEIDLCKCSVSKIAEQESSNASSVGAFFHLGGPSSNLNSQDESDGKIEASEAFMKMDVFDDASLLFAPSELKVLTLGNISTFSEGISPDKISSESSHLDVTTEGKHVVEKNPAKPLQGGLILDVGFPAEYFNLQADYLQLMNHCDCELRASEFQHLASDLHSQHEITSEGHDAAIDALLLSAECYVNPFFLMSLRSSSKVINQMSFNRGKIPRKYEISELRRAYERNNVNFEMIAHLERKRDKTILLILIEAAELDKKYKKNISHGKQCPYDNEGHEQGLKLSAPDTHSADAVTLVRQNQSLLCNFLIQQFQREQHPMHEILMQSLLFLLHSATELVCPPERVIDIILGSAEYLNGLLTSFYHQLKEGNLQLDPEKVHAVQRRWVILQRLVIASSGGGEWQDSAFSVNNGLQYRSLIPLSSWMQRIPTFSSCELPLVRFLGWMAICRYAKQYIKAQLTLASDLSQLTCLLSIFADELAVVDNIINQKDGTPKLEQLRVKQNLETDRGFENSDQSLDAEYFHVIYPDMNKFFPNLKMQFERFGEVILEAVGLQLRNLPSSAVPDVLCWFSELCLYPFLQNEKIQHSYGNGYDNLKGYAAKNAKAIILYILEAIVVEHMEAMVPETPKVVQVLAALCKASYCDVPFLNSILHLLKPLISYSLRKVSADENLLIDESCCLNFESLCFEELFNNIRQIKECQDGCTDIINNGALTIFVLGFLFPDLSFTRRMELLKSLTLWADFATFEPTSSFSDYLCAFQIVMESCDVILIQTLEVLGIFFSAQKSHSLGLVTISDCDGNPKSYSGFVSDVCESSLPSTVDGNVGSAKNGAVAMSKKNYALSTEEIEDFSKFLDSLISNLSPTVELCWNLHHQLAKKLTLTSAKCLMYSRCLLSIKNKFSTNGDGETENLFPSTSNSNVSIHWRFVLEGLVKLVIELQQKHSWQVASVMFDNLLAMPHFICLEDVIGTICSAIKEFCCHAPKISWRVQSDKWLSILLRRSIHGLHEDEAASFADMFCKMLGHPEPEQRSIALQHLRRLASQDLTVGTTKSSSTVCDELGASDIANSVPEQVLSLLVSHTWDAVAMLASFEPSMLLRANAMAVLVDFVPFAKRSQLQSFLGAADRVLCGLGNTSYLTCEGPLTRLSLALLASACLYSSAEDISLIPQSVWRNIEALGMSNAGSLGDLEKKASRALCKLRAEGDSAKEILKEAISSSSVPKESDPDFGSTRDSILQVLANLTSVQSYFDVFTKKIDQEAMEIEEAELEMEILQKEQLLQEPSGDSKQWKQIPLLSTCTKDDNRLQQIKDGICSLEKSKLREEIVARRQKRLIAREARQKYLEEAAMQEAELLQELDRERTAEKEREIERQHLLEFERSKTRELRHNLDMEKERLTQRELQWELEQAESGFRPSRRETSSSTSSSRARERYRERDNGRLGNEGSLRPSSRGRESGSRPFSGQPPTILQPRDRLEERGSSYEENFEGSKDSGDTSSIGDTELPSTMDGQAGGFGTAQRHGSRGSKSRQTMERRERDGRREGKWERKH